MTKGILSRFLVGQRKWLGDLKMSVGWPAGRVNPGARKKGHRQGGGHFCSFKPISRAGMSPSPPAPCLFSLLPRFSVKSFNSKDSYVQTRFLLLIQGPPGGIRPVLRGSPKAPWTRCHTYQDSSHHIYGSHFTEGTWLYAGHCLRASCTHQSRISGGR